jgi:hypothetical protein
MAASGGPSLPPAGERALHEHARSPVAAATGHVNPYIGE